MHVCVVCGVAGTVVNILARSNKCQETSSTAHMDRDIWIDLLGRMFQVYRVYADLLLEVVFYF